MTASARTVLSRAASLAEKGQPYALATVVWRRAPTSAKPGDRALVTADGELYGWIGGGCSEPAVIKECLRALAEGTPRLLRLGPPGELPDARPGEVVVPIGCASEGALEVFVEPHLSRTPLVIVGDAPVAEALERLAGALELDVSRVELDADGTLDLREAGVGAASHVVVATLGRYDEVALEAALGTAAGYVALVGSRKRAAAVLQTLRASGVPEEELSRVRAPAGLDLGSIRQEEIAVAILAEIVKLRGERATSAEAEAGAATPGGEAEAVDPVCGMSVEIETARYTALRDGRTFYFCCDGCRRRFESEPARYVSVG
jgi:xanthine dehydrogenase accessory factor